MRNLKRALLVRYSLAVGLIVLMVIVVLVFGVHAEVGETIFFLVALGVLALLLAGITYRTERTLAEDLKEIGRALEKIVVDNELDHMPQPKLSELNDLAQDLDTVAGRVRENFRLLSQERDRLQAVLESINAGIIVVGMDLRTRMINPVAEKMLGTSAEFATGKTFTEIHHAPSINGAIERAIAGESTTLEINITLPADRALKVQANPVQTQTGKIAGAICVLEDITARRRLERIRSDFVANVSHELRTPVASMRAVVEALMAGAAQDPEAAGRFISDLDKESRRIADIIEDLLVLSRLESGRDEITSEPFEIRELLGEIAGEKAELAAACAVEIVLDSLGEAVMFKGSRKLVKTACSNLLDNSIKYNRPGGRVELSVTEGPRAVSISVRDTGIGIPLVDQKKVFERFYRVDKARSRDTGGTGLGLSIVKHASEFHSGRIELESKLGEGTTFTLVLPSKPALF
jgi:two-component system phosphate regulon sensor histidine kinase PhoR